MKKFLAALVIGLSVFTLSAVDAEAARLGKGSSFGRSMSLPKAPGASLNTPKAPAAAPRAGQQAAAGQAAAASRGMGLGKSLLIGAASALGIMALANMLGLGEGFAQILMVLLLLAAAFFAFRLFAARRMQGSSSAAGSAGTAGTYRSSEPAQTYRNDPPAAQRTGFSQNQTARSGSVMDEFAGGASAAASRSALSSFNQPDEEASASSFEVPADFNKEQFLNMATAYFKMLQKAWDSGDMDSLDNYCTHDMFVSLTHMRRDIRGANLTEVLSLKADLAGFETTPEEYVASVKFSGRLSENGEPVDIEEIWNLTKSRSGKSGWLLAGIEQVI